MSSSPALTREINEPVVSVRWVSDQRVGCDGVPVNWASWLKCRGPLSYTEPFPGWLCGEILAEQHRILEDLPAPVWSLSPDGDVVVLRMRTEKLWRVYELTLGDGDVDIPPPYL